MEEAVCHQGRHNIRLGCRSGYGDCIQYGWQSVWRQRQYGRAEMGLQTARGAGAHLADSRRQLVVMAVGDSVYGFTARSGQMRWVINMRAEVGSTPACDSDSLYITCRDKKSIHSSSAAASRLSSGPPRRTSAACRCPVRLLPMILCMSRDPRALLPHTRLKMAR